MIFSSRKSAAFLNDFRLLAEDVATWPWGSIGPCLYDSFFLSGVCEAQDDLCFYGIEAPDGPLAPIFDRFIII